MKCILLICAMIMEQLFKADVVIFNRCDDNTPKGKFRRAVKDRTVRHRLYTSVPMEQLMRVPMKNCHLTSMQMSLILRMQIMQSGIWMHRIIRRNTMARKSNSFALVYNPEKMSRKGMFVPDVLP